LAEDTPVNGPPPGAQALVLIVDDNPRNLKLARDVLDAAGFRTLEAESAAAAMALAAERLPDVILMDLRLPDLDGIEAARMLGESVRTASIPVVALSALPFAGGGDWLSAAGFAGYIEKPIDVSEFPQQVRAYCSSAAE
jgi:two-component system cell cycle response regulator DivK